MTAAQPAFSLAVYADICGSAIGVEGADYVALAGGHGIDAATWQRGMGEWTERFTAAGEGSPLMREFMTLMTGALARSIGEHAFVSLDTYVEISAHGMAGRNLDRVLKDHGLDMRRFTLAGYEWKAHGEADKRLEVYIALRTQKRIAELTSNADRSQFAIIGPGNLVRARRCRNCGGLKAVKPTTAYVYCDYCATCFDYDASIEFRDRTALDSDVVDSSLSKVIADELQAAFKADDRAAYARALEWQITVSTEICPLAYSPRVKDPDYRRRLINDLLVPWQVLTTFDAQSRADAAKFQAALKHAMSTRRLADILALYAVARASWEHEVTLFERDGLFARHPDGYDPAMYVYVNSSVFVRPWLAVLSDADQQQLLVAAGVACDYIAAPEIAFSKCGCGTCGAMLQVPAGAKRMLCEACGHVLEVGERQFPCRQCGGPLSMPAGGTDVVCGSCNVRWVR